eukprot:scaffold4707_cov19-Prasinocladus_malaysianus.AAC.2
MSSETLEISAVSIIPCQSSIHSGQRGERFTSFHALASLANVAVEPPPGPTRIATSRARRAH